MIFDFFDFKPSLTLRSGIFLQVVDAFRPALLGLHQYFTSENRVDVTIVLAKICRTLSCVKLIVEELG